jgi:NitT/TauT family transport system substrate-binding protein
MRVTMVTAFLAALLPFGSQAQTPLKVAVGVPASWDNAVITMGMGAGIFAKYGVAPEQLFTQGSGETLQATISHSVSVGVGAGSLGTLAAAVKGAPIRIIGGVSTGSGNFWYVKGQSPIKVPADIDKKTIAISGPGSSTDIVALTAMDQYKVKARTVATGNAAATMVAVMSNQVDVGFSFMPIGLDALNKGDIRILFKDNDFPSVRDQTIRISIVHESEANSPTVKAFIRAYAATVNWMYESDDALKAFADIAHVTVPQAREIRDNFYPKELLDPYRVVGLETMINDALKYKFVAAPITVDQVKKYLAIPER